MKYEYKRFFSPGYFIIAMCLSTVSLAQTPLALETVLQNEKYFTPISYPQEITHNIFQNLYPDQKFILSLPVKNGILPLKEMKKQLRNVFVLQFRDNIEIGVDSFKIKPFDIQKNQIVECESYLQYKNKSGSSVRGYGLELRVKL